MNTRWDGEPDLSSHGDFALEEPTYDDQAAGDSQAVLTDDPVYALVLIGVPGLTAYDGAELRERRARARANLRRLAELKRMVDAAIRQSVEKAREQSGRYGWAYDYDTVTWQEIGQDLGITKQSAQGRFGGRK